MTCRSIGHRIAVILALAVTPAAAGCGWDQRLGNPETATEGPSGERDQQPDSSDGTGQAEGTVGIAAVVDRVIDGDSLEVSVDGRPVELRLEGFNAPELHVEVTDGPDELSCNGVAAKVAVETAVAEANRTEVVMGDLDLFGRTLGDLVLDGRSLVADLVAGGRGLATGASSTNRAAMKAAADRSLGMWGSDCGQVTTPSLVIGDIQPDPPGDDRFNLVAEWVEIVNQASNAVDMEGWTLRDDTTGHRFLLSGNLDRGCRLRVVTGGDPADSDPADVDGDRTLYLGERFPVWNNDRETIILVDPDGVLAQWQFVDR